MLRDQILTEGDTFTTRAHLLTAEEIVRFATEYDPQPFHLDDELARDTLFAGLAGSGWHVAAITMRLLVDTVPATAGIIGAAAELRWPTPSRPGDELHVEVLVETVIPSRSRPGRSRVGLICDTVDQHGAVRQHLSASVMIDAAHPEEAARQGAASSRSAGDQRSGLE